MVSIWPRQMSRTENVSSRGFLFAPLYIFSAWKTVLRPGCRPASVSSLAREPGEAFAAGGRARNSVPIVPSSANPLTLSQDRIQARLKILLSFTRKFAAFHRQGALHRFHPAEQLLDVLARLCGIFLAVALHRHPLPERLLERMIGAVERIGRGAGGQNARVPGEEMLKAEVRGKVAGGCGDAFIVGWSVAHEQERLRSLHPLHPFHIERPQIPLGFDEESGIRVQVRSGEGGDFRGAVTTVAQIPFRDGAFRRIDGLNDQLLKGGMRSGKRNARQKPRELRDRGLFGKIARPYAQIRTVGHKNSSIQGSRTAGECGSAGLGRNGLAEAGSDLLEALAQRFSHARKYFRAGKAQLFLGAFGDARNDVLRLVIEHGDGGHQPG